MRVWRDPCAFDRVATGSGSAWRPRWLTASLRSAISFRLRRVTGPFVFSMTGTSSLRRRNGFSVRRSSRICRSARRRGRRPDRRHCLRLLGLWRLRGVGELGIPGRQIVRGVVWWNVSSVCSCVASPRSRACSVRERIVRPRRARQSSALPSRHVVARPRRSHVRVLDDVYALEERLPDRPESGRRSRGRQTCLDPRSSPPSETASTPDEHRPAFAPRAGDHRGDLGPGSLQCRGVAFTTAEPGPRCSSTRDDRGLPAPAGGIALEVAWSPGPACPARPHRRGQRDGVGDQHGRGPAGLARTG